MRFVLTLFWFYFLHQATTFSAAQLINTGHSLTSEQAMYSQNVSQIQTSIKVMTKDPNYFRRVFHKILNLAIPANSPYNLALLILILIKGLVPKETVVLHHLKQIHQGNK